MHATDVALAKQSLSAVLEVSNPSCVSLSPYSNRPGEKKDRGRKEASCCSRQGKARGKTRVITVKTEPLSCFCGIKGVKRWGQFGKLDFGVDKERGCLFLFAD